MLNARVSKSQTVTTGNKPMEMESSILMQLRNEQIFKAGTFPAGNINKVFQFFCTIGIIVPVYFLGIESKSHEPVPVIGQTIIIDHGPGTAERLTERMGTVRELFNFTDQIGIERIFYKFLRFLFLL